MVGHLYINDLCFLNVQNSNIVIISDFSCYTASLRILKSTRETEYRIFFTATDVILVRTKLENPVLDKYRNPVPT